MHRPFASIALIALGLTVGCSISTSPGSITLKTQTKFSGDTPFTKTATTSYAPGSVIEIENGNGDVKVTAVAGLDKISVSTTVFAFADGDKKADADAAIADLAGTIAIDESTGKFYVHCAQAKASHGTASTSTTGCESFTVQVPAGDATNAVNVKATAHNGAISASGLVGSVTVIADNGDATASVSPAAASVVSVSSGNGNATLALPADFATDAITLTAGGPGAKTVNTDFPDVNDGTSVHRKAGGAKSVTVTTENGDVTLKKQ